MLEFVENLNHSPRAAVISRRSVFVKNKLKSFKVNLVLEHNDAYFENRILEKL